MNDEQSKYKKIEAHAFALVITFCMSVPLLFWLFGDGAIQRGGVIVLILYVIILVFAFKAYLNKYKEVYGDPVNKDALKNINLKSIFNKSASRYYAAEFANARDNKDPVKGYESLTKIIECTQNCEITAVSYLTRALWIAEYFYNDENKIKQAISDIEYAYSLENERDDVMGAISNICTNLFLEKDLKEYVCTWESLYNAFPEIAILCTRPFDITEPNESMKETYKKVIKVCNKYVEEDNACSFIYSKRAITRLQIYGIEQLDLVVKDLLSTSKVYSNGIFSSFVRIKGLDYIIRLINSNGDISKVLDNNIQKLEMIVKEDIRNIEEKIAKGDVRKTQYGEYNGYEDIKETLRILKHNIEWVDTYASTFKSIQVQIGSMQNPQINKTTDTNSIKEEKNLQHRRKLDI